MSQKFKALTEYLKIQLGAELDFDLDLLHQNFKSVDTGKKQTLLSIGDVCKSCYFIVSGSIQIFTLDQNGKETTRNFVFENTFLTQLASFLYQKPALEGFRTIENCELLVLDKNNYLRLQDQIPALKIIYDTNLEQSYLHSVERANMLMMSTASEKIHWLLEKYPTILSRLSNKLVASYLDIAPETLSRLKSQL